MKKKTNEFKVGLLVVLSIAILGVIYYQMGEFDFTKETYELKVLFNFAGGIEENAPVRLAGVEVGKVEKIELVYDKETKVALTLSLEGETVIRGGAKAYVSMLGLMGAKYIEINPGAPDMPPLEPGSVIIGEDPFQMEWLTEKSEDIAEKLDETLTEISKLTKNLDAMVVENRDEVDAIMGNLEVTSENIKDLSADLKKHPWKAITKPPGWKKMIATDK